MRVTKTSLPAVEPTAERNQVKRQNATVTLPRIHRNRLSRRRSTAKERHHWITEQDLKEVIHTVARSATQSPTGEAIQSSVSPELARQDREAQPFQSRSSASRSSDGSAETKGAAPLDCECLPGRPSMNNGTRARGRDYRQGSCNWPMLGLLRKAGGSPGVVGEGG